MLTWQQCLRPYFSAVFFSGSFIQRWEVVQNVTVCLLSMSCHKEETFVFVLSSYTSVSCLFFKLNLKCWFELQSRKLLWIGLLCSWVLLLCYYATVKLTDVLLCLLTKWPLIGNISAVNLGPLFDLNKYVDL